jgi:thiol:disulfide interchange protein
MRAMKLSAAMVLAGSVMMVGLAKAQGPSIPRAHIYPTVEAAQGDIQASIVEARKTHKRVILDFGGDWCGDCQVLNIYFHQSPNKELMEKYFVLVDVNIGKEDANLEIARRYGVPMPHGVPALVVLDGHGKILYSQKNEFSDMRHMESSSVTEFLNKWKP